MGRLDELAEKFEEYTIEQIIEGMLDRVDRYQNGIKGMADREEISKKKFQKSNKNLGQINNSLVAFERKMDLLKSNIYTLSPEILDLFARLKSVIDSDEYNSILDKTRNEINLYNKTENAHINPKEVISKIISKMKMERDFYRGGYNPIIENKLAPKWFRFKDTLDVFRYKIEEMYNSGSKFSVQSITYQNPELSELLQKIKDTINGKRILPHSDDNLTKIINEFNEIENAYLTKKKLEHTKNIIENLMSKLKLEKCDFSKTLKTLQSTNKKIGKEIIKLEKYLNKFNFAKVDEAYRDLEKKEDHEKRVQEYEALAYKLEEAKKSGNKEQQREIEEQMRYVATEGNILMGEQKLSEANATANYLEDNNIRESERETFHKSQERLDKEGIGYNYVRYLASLKDKTKAMSFSEYSRQRHNKVILESELSSELQDEISETRGKKI